MLQIYNNLTQKKEPFVPLQPGKIGLYVCGLTVYDYCHVGNARILVTFDFMVRYLRARGFEVKYVRNITDIDDKIIKRAQENNEDYKTLAERFIEIMHEDEKALGVLPPDVEPKATEHMPQIIEIIKTLIDKDYAYVAENGDVYYSVNRFKSYGQLAHQDLEELQAGARVEVTDVKHNPLDFVLWKMSKPNEPAWDSPWGKGRPGWHIECSAMSTHYLGAHFDIHGGGADLQFPHHQNEIAQSEAAFECKFVNMWMHVGYVQIKKTKMSKSLGNFFTLREVLQRYNPEVLRYFMVASHYRSPLNYAPKNLDNSMAALGRFYTAMRDLPQAEKDFPLDLKLREKFYAAMDDDFNTPEALAVLFDLVREINRLRDVGDLKKAAQIAVTLKELGDLLGILQQDPNKFLCADVDKTQNDKIEELIKARNAARKNKDWHEADKIRDQLHSMSIELEDTAVGTIWRVG